MRSLGAFVSRNPILYSFLPFLNTHDNIPKESATVQNADIDKVSETGMERLRRMFTLDENDEASPEISSILQISCMSLFVGAVYGGVMHSRTAYTDFMSNNQASVFRDHLEAKKKLQDSVTKSFGRGAFKWAWRLSLFSTTYMAVSTTVSVYRGKFGLIEHVIAGATSGFLYKFFAGPRAWVVGTCLGSGLGLIAGGITYGMLQLSGSSWDEVRYWQYQWKENRTSTIREAVQKELQKNEMLILHDEKLGETGKSLKNIDITENT